MRRALYVVLSTVLFLLLSPVLLLARKTRRGLLERFGLYRPGTLAEGGWPRVWLHGASAGDLQALAPMIGRFRERFPDARIVLSTITDTGRATPIAYATCTSHLEAMPAATTFLATWRTA